MVNVLDPSICPSCGAPNTCGMSKGECWCFSVSIPKAALERIPAEAKDLACLCPRCAQAKNSAKPEPSAESGVQPVPHE
jgi:arginase family enzyme